MSAVNALYSSSRSGVRARRPLALLLVSLAIITTSFASWTPLAHADEDETAVTWEQFRDHLGITTIDSIEESIVTTNALSGSRPTRHNL